ncbi:MAG: phenylalanine--tRNA ligase subunit alpha [Bacteroidota bacterium]|nr:phenylalanine--tRNA ligase subunit alpha [Bacteroidota bacterium]
MQELIEKYKQEVSSFKSSDVKEIEFFRIKFMSKNGVLNNLFNDFKKIEPEEKRKIGLLINDLKNCILSKIESLKIKPKEKSNVQKFDFTLPSSINKNGSLHPLTIVENKIIEIFKLIGFELQTGPEIEDDWHNFSALNMPDNHPARDMQDTFFLKKNPDLLLRTHTSSVQIRYMENNLPPIRIISPGRVFRNEDVSARSHCLFHQIEGLAIDENINFSDLKLIIQEFVNRLFGEEKKIRFRPSFFPFTEPSAEVDIYWGLKTETDKKITKGTGWLEIMGCGMVDPNVLKNVKIDNDKYSGYAFGMGIERIAMLLYQIDDIRLFYENDVRFLNQFRSSNII